MRLLSSISALIAASSELSRAIRLLTGSGGFLESVSFGFLKSLPLISAGVLLLMLKRETQTQCVQKL